MNKRSLSTIAIATIEVVVIVTFPLFMPNFDAMIASLLVGVPSVVFFLGIIAGVARHPVWLHPLVVLLATAVLVLVHLNSSAWIYAIVFAGVSLIGVFIGVFARKVIADAKRHQ
ncbi:MAG: hypothetical protein Q4P05_09165 [Actinomycetaceae bacterium]|nr:hypothetical protein [Actinomycetaceae bacterium]